MKFSVTLSILLIGLFFLYSLSPPKLGEQLNGQIDAKKEYGKKLFFDKKLSYNNTIACASCHKPHLAFSDTLALSFGVDSNLSKRNSMSLLNLKDQSIFFWDGRIKNLENLIFHPINNELEMNISTKDLLLKLNSVKEYKLLNFKVYRDSVITKKSIEQTITYYLESLSTKSKFTFLLEEFENGDAYSTFYDNLVPGISNNTIRAIEKCSQCHEGKGYGGNLLRNNGIKLNSGDLGVFNVTKDSLDIGFFKTPSLHNIHFTAPYMHDGRFSNLREVINHYNNLTYTKNLSNELISKNDDVFKFNLTEEEINQLLTFLDYLSDSTLLNNY